MSVYTQKFYLFKDFNYDYMESVGVWCCTIAAVNKNNYEDIIMEKIR
jgi:hypothetical protein